MSTDESKHTTAERITLVISVLVLVGILGLVVWGNITTGDAPPVIDVETDLAEMRETDSGFYVPVTITNTGGLTAQSVTVSGELVVDEEEPETAEVTIDFLAGGESEQAELVFTTDPREGELTISPASFLHP